MKIVQLSLSLALLVGGFLMGSFLTSTSTLDNSEQSAEILASIPHSKAQSPAIQTANHKRSSKSTDSRNFGSQENAVIDLFEDAAPSVVFITTSSLAQRNWSMDVTELPKGTGTGFMWDDSGHIVTNFHVLDGGNRFTVTLGDQSSYDATFVGAEPGKDLAVLKIDAPAKIKPLPVGQSSNLRVGQSAYAIGNPFGFDQTLTTGVVSALGREITASNGQKIYDVIQTDAAINPGNSGGPLLDSSGKLIGVNTAIYSPSGAYSGIGFSIPVDVVNLVVPDLIAYGRVNRPVMGVELVNQGYVNAPGAMISKVLDNKPAAQAGLRGLSRSRNGNVIAGDLITDIDGREITSNLELIEALEDYKPDDVIVIGFIRRGALQRIKLKLVSSVN